MQCEVTLVGKGQRVNEKKRPNSGIIGWLGASFVRPIGV